MITFHPDITLAEVRMAAYALDCYLQAMPNGDVQITPRSAQKRPTHTNSNVVKMPRHKLQYIGAQPE